MLTGHSATRATFMSTDTSFDSVIPIPLFILSTRRPPPPDTIRDPGLVDVVLRVCDRLCVCLRNWMAAEDGTRPSALGGGTLAKTIWVHPGDVHFSQEQCY